MSRRCERAGILEAIRNENGCIRYDYFYSEEDENQLLLVENGKRRNVSASIWSRPHMKKLAEIKDRCMTDTKLERFLV